jgi:Domain of unknown function (DUF4468) with TBP-like fold
MKLLTLCVMMVVSNHLFAQYELPVKDGKIYYELIDSAAGVPASSFYAKAKLWFADGISDSSRVIKFEDKENNAIVGKGRIDFYQGIGIYRVFYTVKIMTKENKYRAQFYDFILMSGVMVTEDKLEDYNKKKSYDKVKTKINTIMTTIMDDMKKGMSQKPDNDF